MKRLQDADLSGKTVIIQSNLDVPLEDGKITDDSRLVASLDTIKFLAKQGCRVVLVGHIGRPDGQLVPGLSTIVVAEKLTQLLGQRVAHIPGLVSQQTKQLVLAMPTPSICVLENIRSNPGEEAPSLDFARELASFADAYVNDDYIDSHRKSACNVFLPELLPSYMGFTLRKEWDCVRKAVDHPEKPFALIIGGAKTDKIHVIDHLVESTDYIILGGVLANTFLKASGVDVKASKFDEEGLSQARNFLQKYPDKFILPTDCVVAKEFTETSEYKTVPKTAIPDDWMILDFGPETIKHCSELLHDAKTIVWGGPIGVFEWDNFRHGTEAIAKAAAKADAYSLVAGGDSGAAVHELGLAKQFSHVSIGGGATLHLIAGDTLPAIAALKRQN